MSAKRIRTPIIDAEVRRLLRSDSAWFRRMARGAPRPSDVASLLRLGDWCRLAGLRGIAGDDTRDIAAENIDWQRLDRSAGERCDRLLRFPGVQWVSIGYRRQRGVWTDAPSIVVYVRRKWSAREQARRPRSETLPRFIVDGTGKRVAVDVVGVGGIQRTAGLSSGDRVEPTGDPTVYGTLGMFARDRITQKPMAITAGHVVRSVPEGSAVFTQKAGNAPIRVIGGRGAIATRGFDIGAVDAEGHTLDNSLPGLPSFAGVRMVHPTDIGEAFQTFGATSRAIVRGVLVSPGACGSNLSIQNPIVVDLSVDLGDSGAVLVDLYNYVAGILHGFCRANPRLAVFTPITTGLGALRCEWDSSI